MDFVVNEDAPVTDLQKPSAGPSPFDVSLMSYKSQPWMYRNAQLSQWFNYGLNPSTWSAYSVKQLELYAKHTAK